MSYIQWGRSHVSFQIAQTAESGSQQVNDVKWGRRELVRKFWVNGDGGGATRRNENLE